MEVNRYHNGKIYIIRSPQTDNVYIGSTCGPLSKRLHKHKNHYKRYLEGKHNYVSSYEIVQYDDAYIELVEDFKCERKEQLLKREGEITRATPNTINRCIAGRTREQILQYQSEYYQQNREMILQQCAQPYTCYCGTILTYNHKARHERSKKHIDFDESNNYIFISNLF